MCGHDRSHDGRPCTKSSAVQPRATRGKKKDFDGRRPRYKSQLSALESEKTILAHTIFRVEKRLATQGTSWSENSPVPGALVVAPGAGAGAGATTSVAAAATTTLVAAALEASSSPCSAVVVSRSCALGLQGPAAVALRARGEAVVAAAGAVPARKDQ